MLRIEAILKTNPFIIGNKGSRSLLFKTINQNRFNIRTALSVLTHFHSGVAEKEAEGPLAAEGMAQSSQPVLIKRQPWGGPREMLPRTVETARSKC